MELHLIQNDKLKVLLTPFDMMKYELTCESLDYDNTETRKAIWSILDFAKHETGFDAALGKIRIEVYPEKSGGCAIYITKLAKNDLPSSEDMNETSEKQSSAEGKNAVVYQFDCLDDLLAVCRARGASELFLEVRASNEAAMSLYRAFGFTQCGVRKQYYKHPCEDAYLFSRIDQKDAWSGNVCTACPQKITEER